MAKKKVSQKSRAKKVKVEIVDNDTGETVDDGNLDIINNRAVDIITQNTPDVVENIALPTISSERAITTTDPMVAYMAEVRKYPLLTREQEEALAKKYFDTKDPRFAQALVTSNLRFVVKVAAEYSKFGARLIDLVQEGNMGLMHAVREFNPYKGVRLITYAVWWIRGYIQEYLMKQYSLVKIGTTQNQKRLFYQLQKEKESMEKLNDPEQIKILSEKLGIPQDEVRIMAQRLSGKDLSLDRPIDDQDGVSALNLQKSAELPLEEELSRKEDLSHLFEAIEALRPELNEREKVILEERILNDEPLTLQEIGEKYGTTREAVRQMEARVLKKIKDKFKEIEGRTED
jgi:RNA polymerase sigma-32 factor